MTRSKTPPTVANAFRNKDYETELDRVKRSVVAGGGAGTPGPQGPQGPAGAAGATGPAGPGVAAGGTTDQLLAKLSGVDYATKWVDPSAAGNVTIEAWKAIPGIGNNWADYGGSYPAQYRKRPDGIVELRGLLRSGNNGQDAFTMPVGYRPAVAAEAYFTTAAYSGSAYFHHDCYISGATGLFRSAYTAWGAAGSGWVALDGIRYSSGDTTFPTGPAGPQGPAGATGASGSENYVKGTRATDMALPTGSETTIIWTTQAEQFGPNPPTVNTSNGWITVNETAEYTITFYGYMSDSATTASRRIGAIRSNVKGMIARDNPMIQGNNNPSFTITTTLRLTSGEQISATVFQDSGAAMNLLGSSGMYMTVTKVGPGPQGPTGATGGNATANLDPWHVVGSGGGEPAFQNGWVNFVSGYASAAFRKDPFGRVHLRGLIKSGTVGQTFPIFTLPVGYRPAGVTGSGAVIDSVVSNGAFGDVRVESTGNVYLQTGTGGYVSLDGISFDTDSVTSYMVGPKGDSGASRLAQRTTLGTLTTTTLIAFTEISSGLRVSLTPLAGYYYRFLFTSQWEHNTNLGYMAAEFRDVVTGTRIPGAYFVNRAFGAGLNLTFSWEAMVSGAELLAIGIGARQYSIFWSTGSGTCSLRADTNIAQFTAMEMSV